MMDERQLDRKRSATSDAVAGSAETATMGVDERLADGQAKSKSAELARHCRRALLKRVEQPGKNFRSEPDAGIGNGQCKSTILAARANRDGAAFGCKFDRVLDQVPEDLLKPGRIAVNFAARGLHLLLESQMLCMQLRCAHFDDVAEQPMHIHILAKEAELALSDARQIEQIVDQPRLQLDVAADHFQIIPKPFRQILFTRLHL